MKPYLFDFTTEHGGRINSKSGTDTFIDFSVSVNPYQPEWKDEIFSKAAKRAPDYVYWDSLEKELGEIVDEDLAITAGATEAIYLVGVLLLRLGSRVLIPEHTYSEYERISRMFGCEITKCPGNPEDMAEMVEKDSVVFFCNPNNPDGKYFPPDRLKPLVEAVEDTESILILDEAFMDFVQNYRSPESERIIRLRTFTKSYGMPGIRVGYVIGFAEEFRKVRMPWSIGSAGYAFLEKVVEDEFGFLRKTMPKIWKEKNRIERNLGLKSDANFFLMKTGKGTVDYLKSRGIVVRDCTSFGLPGYIRFSVRMPEENSKLIDILKSSL
jgi:histidinol-phosphate aminotransferase